MLPTLRPGEDVLVVPVNPTTQLSPQDVVICHHPLMPHIRMIKRVSEIFYDGSCYVLSDNATAGSDSRSFGVVDRQLIIGQVTSRLL